MPVVLSGVRFRGRVLNGPIVKIWSESVTPASQLAAAGFDPPPWQSPHACEITNRRPCSTCPADPAAATSAPPPDVPACPAHPASGSRTSNGIQRAIPASFGVT
jgi:hypothetical protein